MWPSIATTALTRQCARRQSRCESQQKKDCMAEAQARPWGTLEIRVRDFPSPSLKGDCAQVDLCRPKPYRWLRHAVLVLGIIGGLTGAADASSRFSKTRIISPIDIPVWHPSQSLAELGIPALAEGVVIMHYAPHPDGSAIAGRNAHYQGGGTNFPTTANISRLSRGPMDAWLSGRDAGAVNLKFLAALSVIIRARI